VPIKPPGPVISQVVVKLIHKAVDHVFDRIKLRMLSTSLLPKQIEIGYNRAWSLPGIFEAASREEGTPPDLKTLKQLLDIAGGYVDATRHRTKAQVVNEVTSFLKDAHMKGVKTDLPTVLGGKLTEVARDTMVSMRRIVEAETNNVKNVGILEGAIRINSSQGINDPVVYWVGVNDSSRCDECWRLYSLPDRITPKVYKLSEVGHSYHKKGEDSPKIGGAHVNCQCTLATLMPGFGFVGGRVAFVSNNHDELAKQRSQQS